VHRTYVKILNHNCDFKVKYKFYSEDEGGRKNLPFQGIRSDFFYEHENHEQKNQIFMIWPEFEDLNHQLIQTGSVLKEGVARMWIINNEMREYHQKRIIKGTIGYFREEIKSTGICEVIEIVDLFKNPIK
jgi:hypothetical protein